MIVRVKIFKNRIRDTRVQINTYLGTLRSYEFKERLTLEFCRIELEAYEKILNQIAMNILGKCSGIYEIEKETIFNRLNTVIAMESSQIVVLSKEIDEMDDEFQIMKGSDNAKKEALNKLKDILKKSQNIRIDLTKAHMEDLDDEVVNDAHMDMIQEAHFHILISGLVWFEKLVQNYYELILRTIPVPEDKF